MKECINETLIFMAFDYLWIMKIGMVIDNINYIMNHIMVHNSKQWNLIVYPQIVLGLHYANKERVIPYMNVSNQQEVGCESGSKKRGVVNLYM